jgi:hypothetical protein
MLSILEFLLFAGVVLFLGLPVIWGWRLVFLYLRQHDDASLAEGELPRAAVILPLRGADLSLRQCLRGLLDQDYPQFTLHIVVDSQADPAWNLVHQILAEGHGPQVNVHVDTLNEPSATCTLKVSSLIQAVTGLDESVQVIAMIDADVIPSRTWLRTLVTPLADPQVGAVTGVRWYAPRQTSWGALVRQLWNGGAVAQMYAFGHPWGGTLALPTRLLHKDRLLEEWRVSFSDDSAVGDLLRRLRLKLRFLPTLTMINCESIDLKGCCRFIRRQLLCPRLSFRTWPIMLAVNIGNAVAVVVAAAMVALGLGTGHPPWAAWFGGALAVYAGGMFCSLFFAGRLVRSIVGRRGEPLPPAPGYLKSLVAGALAHVINTGCLASAMFARRIRWRGVEYRLAGPRRIRLAEYRPFAAEQLLGATDHSIL